MKVLIHTTEKAKIKNKEFREDLQEWEYVNPPMKHIPLLDKTQITTITVLDGENDEFVRFEQGDKGSGIYSECYDEANVAEARKVLMRILSCLELSAE